MYSMEDEDVSEDAVLMFREALGNLQFDVDDLATEISQVVEKPSGGIRKHFPPNTNTRKVERELTESQLRVQEWHEQYRAKQKARMKRPPVIVTEGE